MKVFISYAWTDTPVRIAVASAIEKIPGIEIFFDRKNLKAAESLSGGIAQLLESSNLLITILTESSIKSGAVRDEIARANQLGKQILPLVSDTVDEKEIPPYLKDILQVRFSDSTLDSSLSELVQQVSGLPSDREALEQGASGTAIHVSKSHTAKINKKEADLNWLQRSDLGTKLVERVIDYCKVYRFSFSMGGKPRIFPVFVSPNTFIPDDWTRSILKGILSDEVKEIFTEKSVVVEIGIGTGIIPVVLARYQMDFIRYYGYDIDMLATKVADINIDMNDLSSRVTVAGGVPLFEPERNFELVHPYADIVIANIPQVPSLSTGPIRDHFDYYKMPATLQGQEKLWAMRGLLLVAQILKQGKSRLNENGCFVLNIGARTDINNIDVMISDLGYKKEIVHKARIKQDLETDISAFVHFEDTEKETYIFYPDADSESVIHAREAYSRMQEGGSCYHDIYVMKLTPK